MDGVSMGEPGKSRFPEWLRRPLPEGGGIGRIKRMLAEAGLHTVCQSAGCPNIGGCFSSGTATFLILGPSCTRGCGFCAIDASNPGPLDPDEPRKVAEAAARLGLSHTVITSVTRDDLADGGSGHFAETVRRLREIPGMEVEVLVPDFRGRKASIAEVVESGPAVFNHNIETVPGLYYRVRPRADYRTSLDVLKYAKWVNPGVITKSGMMLGLGEEDGEVRDALEDLRRACCDILTLGQYLRPSERHLEVVRFVTPAEFDRWKAEALSMGFRAAACAPLVRSSHGAAELLRDARASASSCGSAKPRTPKEC